MSNESIRYWKDNPRDGREAAGTWEGIITKLGLHDEILSFEVKARIFNGKNDPTKKNIEIVEIIYNNFDLTNLILTLVGKDYFVQEIIKHKTQAADIDRL